MKKIKKQKIKTKIGIKKALKEKKRKEKNKNKRAELNSQKVGWKKAAYRDLLAKQNSYNNS